jgi:hypothetical protein
MGSPRPLIDLAGAFGRIAPTSAGFGVQQLAATLGTIRLRPRGRLVTVLHTRAVMSEGTTGPVNSGYASGAVRPINLATASWV